ncbi:hypothetical protein HK405_015192, partial [Cladochytrium tenue]
SSRTPAPSPAAAAPAQTRAAAAPSPAAAGKAAGAAVVPHRQSSLKARREAAAKDKAKLKLVHAQLIKASAIEMARPLLVRLSAKSHSRAVVLYASPNRAVVLFRALGPAVLAWAWAAWSAANRHRDAQAPAGSRRNRGKKSRGNSNANNGNNSNNSKIPTHGSSWQHTPPAATQNGSAATARSGQVQQPLRPAVAASVSVQTANVKVINNHPERRGREATPKSDSDKHREFVQRTSPQRQTSFRSPLKSASSPVAQGPGVWESYYESPTSSTAVAASSPRAPEPAHVVPPRNARATAAAAAAQKPALNSENLWAAFYDSPAPRPAANSAAAVTVARKATTSVATTATPARATSAVTTAPAAPAAGKSRATSSAAKPVVAGPAGSAASAPHKAARPPAAAPYMNWRAADARGAPTDGDEDCAVVRWIVAGQRS